MGCTHSVPVVLDGDNEGGGSAPVANDDSGGAASAPAIIAGVVGGAARIRRQSQQRASASSSKKQQSPPPPQSNDGLLLPTRDRIDSWAPSVNSNQSSPPRTFNGSSTNNNGAAVALLADPPGSLTAPDLVGSGGGGIDPAALPQPHHHQQQQLLLSPSSPASSRQSRQSRKQGIEAQWRYLWEAYGMEIVDPADVHAVLDAAISRTTNRLSPVEVTLLQRKVRSVVASMKKRGGGSGAGLAPSSNHASADTAGSGGSGGGVASSSGVVGKTMRALSFHTDSTATTSAADAQRAVSLAEKQMLLNETVLSRIVPSVVLQNTYAIMVHLSPMIWDRVADIAAHASQKARLEMDVNKQSADKWRMPKPSVVPDVEQAPELPSGGTMRSFCYVVATALRGTRQQRLQLLFYLCMDDLGKFLDNHCAGGVPTWLLEVDQETVVSLPSLTHYHYYGTAFLPSCASSPQQRQQHRSFIPSQSRSAVSISVEKLQQVLEACCSSDIVSVFVTTATVDKTNTMKRSPHSADNLISNHSNHGGAMNGGITSGRHPLRSFSCNQAAVEAGNSLFSTVFPDTPVMRRLASPNDNLDVAETAAIESKLDQLPSNYESLTLQEFAVWANMHLDDAALGAILERLFGNGLPTAKMERELAQEQWHEWQTAWRKYAKATSQAAEESSTLERITQTVAALMDPCYSNGVPSNDIERSRQVLRTWGGIGGIDGGGAMGFGVLYCIDKRWWDAWAAYVGWTWIGDEPPSTVQRQVRKRPGALSTEALLDNGGEVLRGTMGSYESMKHGLTKDDDYVLVPPGVWDVLYELYSGGPPLPRMIKPPERKFSDSNRFTTEISDTSQSSYNGEKDAANNLDELVHSLSESGNQTRVNKLPESLAVALHPWVVHVHLCDPLQPYRRGEAGPVTIRIMAAPDQPLWRLYVEAIARFPLQGYKTLGSDNRGMARLWKRVDRSGAPKDPVSRYGPWNLLCKNRHAILPDLTYSKEISENFTELVQDWKGYADNATVESIGLGNHDHVMLEFAVLNKNGELAWPREAAAKAGHVRRLAEEDAKFRRTLAGVDEKGTMLLMPPTLVGMEVDAMDSTGRWYPVSILEADVVDDDTDDENEEDNMGRVGLSRKKVRVDFTEHGGHQEWIDVESDRIAVAGRFTNETERQSSETDGKSNGSKSTAANDQKPKPVQPVKKSSGDNTETAKICLWPGYGACGLTNLGNTCYVNSAIQCISYLPLLRSYLLSGQYKSSGDLNKDNPLGTGGKLLEEFAELLRFLWSARFGEKSPTRFRTQLGKINSQFSGADQQDAQEFLNYILDVLHEDSNKVRQKPYVEALDDDWVKQNALPRVGDEAWRR